MTGLGTAAEYRELWMESAWSCLMPRLREVAECLPKPPHRVLEIGVGSGRGLLRIADTWPEADLVRIEPDPITRAMLMSHLAADSTLRARTTVLPLPVASGTLGTLVDQVGERVELVVVTQMAGTLQPDELQVLMRLIHAVLTPDGVAVITYSKPSVDQARMNAGTGTVAEGCLEHQEATWVGRHTIVATHVATEDGSSIRYDQQDERGTTIRSAIRKCATSAAPAAETIGLNDFAQQSGLSLSNRCSWDGGLVFGLGSMPRPRKQKDSVDWVQISADQTARIQSVDPLVGPTPGADDHPADLLQVETETGPLWGIPRRTETAADDPVCLWGPRSKDILQIYSRTTPALDSLIELLTRFVTRIEAEGETGSGDRAGIIRIPSVFSSWTRPMLAAGFRPQSVTAIQPIRTSMAGLLDPTENCLRKPTENDRERILDLAEEMHASDVAAGSAWPRKNARTLLSSYVDELIAAEDGWVYVAEDGEQIVGFIALSRPEASTWAAPATSLTPSVYLGLAAVTAKARRQGIGRRLTNAVHRKAAISGQSAILLDHAALSPLSAPFWHRQGYRPLWTTWLREV